MVNHEWSARGTDAVRTLPATGKGPPRVVQNVHLPGLPRARVACPPGRYSERTLAGHFAGAGKVIPVSSGRLHGIA